LIPPPHVLPHEVQLPQSPTTQLLGQ